MLKKLTSENLDKIAKKEKELYIIYFSSRGCGPCKTIKPVLEELDKRNPNVNIYSVESENAPELTQRFEVRSVPTVLFCRQREILYSEVGVKPLNHFQFVIENIDDPYFVEYGEFKVEKTQEHYVYLVSVLIVILIFTLLFIFG